MKRRSFTFGLAALASAPALPVPVAASAAAPSVAAQHFTLAKLIARAHNRCTLDMLQRHLRVSPQVASEVQSLLLERGVITSPVAGVSMATNPINTNCVPKEALKSTNFTDAVHQTKARVRELMERHKSRMEQMAEHLEEPQPDDATPEPEQETDAPRDTPPQTET